MPSPALRVLTVSVAALVTTAVIPLRRESAPDKPPTRPAAESSGVIDALHRAAPAFEPELAGSGGVYVARGNNYRLRVGTSSFEVVPDAPGSRTWRVGGDRTDVTVTFDGASKSARVHPVRPRKDKSNYIFGNDPENWHLGVSRYDAVRCSELYRGIDALFYSKEGTFEYDFEIEPGADPSQIQLSIRGADGVKIDDGGDLIASLGSSEFRQRAPVAYTVEDGGTRRPVDARYELVGANEVAIELGAYDRSRSLVIDPALGYSTFYGGTGEDEGLGIAVDEFGSAYVVGRTSSPNMHILNPFQADINEGGSDAFISKLGPGGDELEYSTYLGGSGEDYATAIAVDGNGAAYVTGRTTSVDFPTLSAFQTGNAGGDDAFVTKIGPGGNVLLYSTFYGGADSDIPYGIAVDPTGAAAIVGETRSSDLPMFIPFQPNIGSGDGGTDAFVAKFSAAGNVRLFATYLGGNSDDWGFGIAMDTGGAVYVTGMTSSVNFPRVRAFRNSGEGLEAFVTKLDTRATVNPPLVVFSSLVGGSLNDIGNAVDVDPTGAVYLTGSTESADFPTPGGFQRQLAGDYDSFLLKIAASGSGVLTGTFIGGADREEAHGIRVDSTGAAYLTGLTNSGNFPLINQPPEVPVLGNGDAYVVKVEPAGNAMEYSMQLGGTSFDYANAIAIDDFGSAYVTGSTSSPDFPEVFFFQSGGFGGGDGEAFISRIVGVFEFAWEAPDATSTDLNPPPRNLTARDEELSGRVGLEEPGSQKRADVICYTLYQTPRAGGTRRAVRQVPPTQTRAPGVAGGARFVVTACYDDGSESEPSKEIGAGIGEARITSVTIKGSKVTAVGANFGGPVSVRVDGLAFTAAPKIKKNTKLVQKGTLENGQTIAQYLNAHPIGVFFEFENANGAVAGYVYRP